MQLSHMHVCPTPNMIGTCMDNCTRINTQLSQINAWRLLVATNNFLYCKRVWQRMFVSQLLLWRTFLSLIKAVSHRNTCPQTGMDAGMKHFLMSYYYMASQLTRISECARSAFIAAWQPASNNVSFLATCIIKHPAACY